MNEQEEIKYHNQLWYYKTYNQLIDKCIQMESDGYPDDMYTEVHHILPKCMGGTNDKFNLVRMPVRYHIVAHLLLSCAFSNNYKLALAASQMLTCNDSSQIERKLIVSKFSVRLSTYFREQKIKFTKGKYHPNFGKHLSESTRKKISEAVKGEKNGMYGRHPSEETLKKKSLAMTGKKMPPVSEETRRKLSIANKGRYPSEETRKKLSQNSARKKGVIDPEGKEFPSIISCAKHYNIPDSTLSQWIRKYPEKGFKFKDN